MIEASPRDFLALVLAVFFLLDGSSVTFCSFVLFLSFVDLRQLSDTLRERFTGELVPSIKPTDFLPLCFFALVPCLACDFSTLLYFI